MQTVAALCVARNSVYKTLPGVECFDIDRDMRSFAWGSMPIIAHPPCRAWSAYCRHQAKPLPGEKELAPLCVEMLKVCGGVLEHPAHSTLWGTLGLPLPLEQERGWLWCLAVDQSWWGDTRTKKTWLLLSGIAKDDLPPIPYRLHNPSGDRRRWQVMSKHQRAATHPAFAEWLVEVARRSTLSHPSPATNESEAEHDRD